MKSFLYLLVLSTFIIFLGCEQVEEDKNNTGTPRDSTGAAAKIVLANTQLENVLYDLTNDPDPESPSAINFTAPYQLYREALALDSLNPTAHFGVGLLEILMLSRETSMQQIFDDWRDFFERDSMFEIPLPSAMRRQPSKPMPVLSGADIALPVMSPLTIMKSMTNGNRIMTTDPSIRDLQDFLLANLVPRLSTAIQHLQFVANRTSFTFTVTPRMQGDPGEDVVYLDLTEINATLAALNTLKAQMLHMCSYDMGFDAYTSAGMRDAFAQNSPFMALRTGGTQRMSDAGNCWVAAIDALNRAITHLEAETGNQSRHLIKIDPNDGISRADLDSIKHYLPKVRQSFVTSERFTLDADGSDTTPDVNLDISMRQFFHNPVSNLKALLPAYTVTLDTGIVIDDRHFWNNYDINVVFPTSGFYEWVRVVEMEYGNVIYQWENITMNLPELNSIWDSRYQEYRNYPFAHLRLELTPNFYNMGMNIAQVNFNVSYDIVEKMRWQPVITWQAATYQEWILPNPTINGLFPGITTDALFKETFGLSEDGWNRRTVLELWDD